MARPRLDLAVGVIATAGLDLAWEAVASLVDVIEVEPQTMWTPRPDGGWDVDDAPLSWVQQCGKPTLVHGVGFPVGGAHAPNPRAVALAAECTARLGATHWSEHLSFNRVCLDGNEFDAGFLLPPAQTGAGVDAAVEHIGTYQDASSRPFLIETGVNYLRPRDGELSDGQFIAQIAERANCGILLDLHNLLTNQRNGRQSVGEVLDELPLDRVLEIHVAGGFTLNDYYLDAHIGGPDAELLALTSAVIPRLPNLRAVIFEAVPESMTTLGADGLRVILESLQRVCTAPGQIDMLPGFPRPARAPRPHPSPPNDANSDETATRAWESRLAAYTARVVPHPPDNDPGCKLLRTLADQARLGQLARTHPSRLRALIRHVGEAAATRLLEDYLDACPPQRWAHTEGSQFDEWLATTTPSAHNATE